MTEQREMLNCKSAAHTPAVPAGNTLAARSGRCCLHQRPGRRPGFSSTCSCLSRSRRPARLPRPGTGPGRRPAGRGGGGGPARFRAGRTSRSWSRSAARPALDRDPMVLYRHAPNKAALLDGDAETILIQLQVDSADPDWAGQLRAVARDYRRLALAHPNVVPLLVTRPLATPLALRSPGTPRPYSPELMPSTSTGPSSAFCTATSSTSPRSSSIIRTRPTTCCGLACTGCRSSNSRCSAASPLPWPL